MVGHVLASMNEVVSNNYDSSHQALDIVSSDHTTSDIIALDSGIVETAVKDAQYTDHNTKGLATYGNYVKIKQTNGKTALYAHMEYGSVTVNPGDFVEKGAVIGTMGSTGNAYGNHLHLEVRDENNTRENPMISLNEVSNDEPVTSEPISSGQASNSENKNESQNITTKNNNSISNTKTINSNIQTDNSNTQTNSEFLSNPTYKYGSIVDGLKEIGIDSSYDHRKEIAIKNGITDYHGSYDQNVKLLSLLKEGKLIKA